MKKYRIKNCRLLLIMRRKLIGLSMNVKIYRAFIFLLLGMLGTVLKYHYQIFDQISNIMISFQKGPTVNAPVLIDSRLKDCFHEIASLYLNLS